MCQMVAAGRGDFPTAFGAQVEHIFLNLTDPSPQLPEGERSTVAHPHPLAVGAGQDQQGFGGQVRLEAAAAPAEQAGHRQ